MNSKRQKRFPPLTEQLEKRELLTVTTTMLADFSPGVASSEFSGFDASGDKLYFNVNDTELWQTDGTESGTLKLANVASEGDSINVGAHTFFNAGGESIWRTDGTPEGTFQLISGERLRQAVNLGDQFFFATANGLYRSDGTQEGTQLIASDYQTSLVATSESVFYINRRDTISVVRGPEFQSEELQLSDGWLSDFPHHLSQDLQLHVTGDRVVFVTNHVFTDQVFAWASDGTIEGTQRLAAGFGRPWNNRLQHSQIGDKVLLPFSRQKFLSTDGTREGTTVFEHDGHDNSFYAGEYDGRAYFVFHDLPVSDTRAPIYSTDGNTFRREMPYILWGTQENDASFEFASDASTERSQSPQSYFVRDEAGLTQLRVPSVGMPMSSIQAANVGTNWYFRSRATTENRAEVSGYIATGEAGTGIELPFQLDELLDRGTTVTIGDAENRKPHEAPLFTFDTEGGSLYAFDGGLQRELITSLPDDPPLIGGGFRRFSLNGPATPHHYDAEGFFYFTKNDTEFGREVWVSDGTAEGTSAIDLNPGETSSEPTLHYWNGRTVVTATTPENGQELFIINVDDLRPDNVIVETDDYSIVEGNVLALQASVEGSNLNPGREFLYSWDLNGDGEFDIETTAANITISWEELTSLTPAVAPGFHNVTLRGVNQATGESSEDTTTLYVRDARQAWLDVPRELVRGTYPVEINSYGSHEQMEFALVEAPESSFTLGDLDVSEIDFQASPRFEWTTPRPRFEVDFQLVAIARDTITGEIFQDALDLTVTNQLRPEVSVNGDTDENGIVDFADFLTLNANYSRRGAGLTAAVGNFNGDLAVDLADFLILSQTFGRRF